MIPYCWKDCIGKPCYWFEYQIHKCVSDNRYVISPWKINSSVSLPVRRWYINVWTFSRGKFHRRSSSWKSPVAQVKEINHVIEKDTHRYIYTIVLLTLASTRDVKAHSICVEIHTHLTYPFKFQFEYVSTILASTLIEIIV